MTTKFFLKNTLIFFMCVLFLWCTLLYIPSSFGYGGGGGSGGSSSHRECINEMCLSVIGLGANECSANLDCTGNINVNMNGTITNQNMNGNQNININENINQNINENTNSGIPERCNFPNLSRHWAKNNIAEVCKNAVIFNDAFRLFPDAPISRGELVKSLILTYHGYDGIPTREPFKDVSLTNEYASYISKALSWGWVFGNPDGTFKPYDIANRAAGTKVLMLANFPIEQIIGSTIVVFNDTISGAWYERFTSFAFINGYIKGYQDRFGNFTGRFGPGKSITYAELATMMTRVAQGTASAQAKGWLKR